MRTNTTSNDLITLADTLAAGFADRAAEADHVGRLPAEDVAALLESGYTGLTVPRELGGMGASMREAIEAHLHLAAGSAATALLAAMSVQIFGSERERRTWPDALFERLGRLAAGGALFNSIASEPKMGSPSHGEFYATTAVFDPDRDGYCINGYKNWITGGSHLTHMLVKLMVDGEPAIILVEGNRAGLRWEHTWKNALSLRASDSDNLYFEDVFVPADNLIRTGPARHGHNGWFPMVIAATYLGVAIAARDTYIRYALERVPTGLGKPIATLPKIKRQIGEVDLQLQAAQALLLDVAAGWPTNPAQQAAYFPRITSGKQLACATAARTAQQVLHMAGGAGISNALPFERLFRDAQAGAAHPPAGDVAFETIGEAAIEAVSAE